MKKKRGDYKRKNDGCFSASLAFILNENEKDIPLFIKKKNWLKSLRKFCAKYGYDVLQLELFKSAHTHITSPIILVGHRDKKKKRVHAVVYKKGKLLYDSSKKGKGLKGDPLYSLVLLKRIKIKDVR